jgi:putative ABC transport system permease protein
LLPRAEREFVLGDLEELHGTRPMRYLRALLGATFALRVRGPRFFIPTPRRQPMSSLGSDLRHGLRQLRRRPGFTGLAVVTLALGMGATTAIYSVVNPILFRSLPYPESDRIVSVWQRDRDGKEDNTGYATFLDVQRMATSFSGIAVSGSWQPTLQGRGEPERLNGQRVTGDFLRVYGISPLLGRDFTAAEQVRPQHRVVLLSYALWRRRFSADSGIVGHPVTFDGFSYQVVGVMPKGFEDAFSPGTELWAPLAYSVALPYACRTCHHLREIARLKPGVSEATAKRELDLISARLLAQYPTEYQAAGTFVIPLQTLVTRAIRPALLALLGAVGLLLLIACANVSALLLGRALQRETEFAIRGALGAGRWRVARQLLGESTLLAALGGGLGVLLAWAGMRGLASLGHAALPRWHAVHIDLPVLGFSALLSLVTGVLFGLVPALAATRPDLFTALRPGGKTTRQGRHIARALLVGGEVAMAAMLLAGAGLLLRSLDKLLAVDPGFDASRLLTMEVQTTGARYNDNAPTWEFFTRALTAVKAVPGVEQAGWISQLPLGGNVDRYGVQIESQPLANPEEAPSADRYSITPGYLEAMRIPLLRGRRLTEADAIGHQPVALVNQAFARQSWAGKDPIGDRVQVGGKEQPWRTIVGVVGDVSHTGLDVVPGAQLYLPEVQWQFADGAMILTARTRGDPASLAKAVEAAIHSVDPTLPILQVATMEEVLSGTAEQRRFAMLLFQVFAMVALALAAAGIYGVLGSNVTERTREIGIRSALGASSRGVLGLIVRDGLRLALPGVVLGSLGALVGARVIHNLLFGIGPNDPLTFGAVIVLLTLVAVLGSLAPAWRATRVTPLEALRSE